MIFELCHVRRKGFQLSRWCESSRTVWKISIYDSIECDICKAANSVLNRTYWTIGPFWNSFDLYNAILVISISHSAKRAQLSTSSSESQQMRSLPSHCLRPQEVARPALAICAVYYPQRTGLPKRRLVKVKVYK